jgi:hypothetical protein
MYGRDSAWFQHTYGLIPACEVSVLRSFRDVRSGLAWAALTGITLKRSAECMVVGGACLSYCDGVAERIGLEVIADVLAPLHLAQALQVPCLIYLGVAEEAMASESAVPLDAWRTVGDAVEAITLGLAKAMRLEPPLVFRTDSEAAACAVEKAARLFQDQLTDARLTGLYAVASSGRAAVSPGRLSQYRRNVVSYLPSIIASATGVAVSHIVAAENVHQVKAVRLASLLARDLATIGKLDKDESADRIDHLVYLSPPSITGTRRMSQARPDSTIYLLHGEAHLAAQVQRMSNGSRHYWTNVWPRSLLAAWFHDDDSPPLANILAHVQQFARNVLGPP